jgi:hypothetical protein
VWAVAALGPVPHDPYAAAAWEEKAGWAASYRELTGWDDESAPLGPSPGAMRADHQAAWQVAHAHLDLPDSRALEHEMSEAQHRARIEAWRHEQRWAPAHVDRAETATAREAADAGQDAAMWHARELEEPAAAARAASNEGWQRHAELDGARDARGRWLAETAVTRDNAERSAEHLRAAGVDPAGEDDRVTAGEWVAEHERATVEEETHRPVTDADVDDRPREELPAPADEAVETAVPDIRERSERHVSEDVDTPAEAPAPDAMDVIRSRAAEVAPELDARRAAEAERDELERMWHADDQATEDAQDSGDVLVDA